MFHWPLFDCLEHEIALSGSQVLRVLKMSQVSDSLSFSNLERVEVGADGCQRAQSCLGPGFGPEEAKRAGKTRIAGPSLIHHHPL